MTDTHAIAMKMRRELDVFPPEFLGSMSYAIEEVVADDTYDLLKHIDKGWEVLDIGANFGVFSLAACEARAARIVAIEPHPSTFAHLVQITSGMVECCNHAMGMGTKMRMFDGGNPVLHQVKPTGDGPEVFCATMQHMLKQYRIGADPARRVAIKIDCEGGETALLASQEDTHALIGTLRARKGRLGMELHYGSGYYSATGATTNESDWDMWRNKLPSYCVTTITQRVGNIAFLKLSCGD